MQIRRYLLGPLALTAALVLSAPAASAAVYVVHADGSGDFPTIQAAILGVETGDTIELTAGLFTGVGNRDLHFVDRSVTLRSQSGDPADVVIDCQGSAVEPHRAFHLRGSSEASCEFAGLTIRGGYAWGES